MTQRNLGLIILLLTLLGNSGCSCDRKESRTPDFADASSTVSAKGNRESSESGPVSDKLQSTPSATNKTTSSRPSGSSSQDSAAAKAADSLRQAGVFARKGDYGKAYEVVASAWSSLRKEGADGATLQQLLKQMEAYGERRPSSAVDSASAFEVK